MWKLLFELKPIHPIVYSFSQIGKYVHINLFKLFVKYLSKFKLYQILL